MFLNKMFYILNQPVNSTLKLTRSVALVTVKVCCPQSKKKVCLATMVQMTPKLVLSLFEFNTTSKLTVCF